MKVLVVVDMQNDFVDGASCCAGVTPESHSQALGAMKMCQITIEYA